MFFMMSTIDKHFRHSSYTLLHKIIMIKSGACHVLFHPYATLHDSSLGAFKKNALFVLSELLRVMSLTKPTLL